MKPQTLIVSGATCQVGYFLLPRLVEAGFHIYALSRHDPSSLNMVHPFVTWCKTDVSLGWNVPEIHDALHFIHLAPLWLLPPVIEDISRQGVQRIVALSSTSRFTKISSNNIQEQEIAKKLIKAEECVIEECNKKMISWTLLRPTLIYGCSMDRNVTTISRFIKRFGFFPLAGEGKGIRQPVHAGDVAEACFAVLSCRVAYNRNYNLTGGQTLTFREMVENIFLALNRKPRIIFIPRRLMFFLIKAAACTQTYRHINEEMVERVDYDMCFDSSDAQRDFGYLPRKFHYQDGILPVLN